MTGIIDTGQEPDSEGAGSTTSDIPSSKALGPPPMPSGVDNKDLLQMRKEIWQKAVDTQMHFNEMCVKSRQLGLSFVIAALGVAVVLLSRPESFLVTISLGSSTHSTHASSLLVLVAALGLFAVSWLDLGVYHRMLRGAVEFGECLERTHIRQLMGTPNGMTELISIYSRHKEVDRPGEGQREYIGRKKVTAEQTIRRFYWGSIGVLIAVSFLLGVAFYRVESAATTGHDARPSGSQPDGSVATGRPDAH